ncbi:MAG: ferrous iron transporter B [Candidatus Riflebacteria bacterium]|nr:ferrous iron transporter B [Candidatus Riflebacteria bacterium]
MASCSDCPTCCQNTVKEKPKNGRVVIVGNLNVGKTTIFSRLTGKEAQPANVPGSTVTLQSAQIESLGITLYDTPGTYSVFSKNEDEVASRDALLMPQNRDYWLGILLVADAKNIKRSMALAMQYAEYGLPMLVVVNMIDEAASRGIQIEFNKLSEIMGVDVCTTVATEGIGLKDVWNCLSKMRIPNKLITYSSNVEQFIELLEKLLHRSSISLRIIAVLLLTGDHAVEEYIKREFGPGMLVQLMDLVEDFRREGSEELFMALVNLYLNKSDQISQNILTVEPPSGSPFVRTFGDWCMQPISGIPIALFVLTAMFVFVGEFGAEFLVESINDHLFREWIIPFCNRILQPIPIPFIRDLIMDPHFGIIPTGVFLALGVVTPVMLCFYLAFGILEDSGYLSRLAVLLNRAFRRMGLNGKGVVPLVMGFSCVTMAILSTRVLDTKKEKNIASFLLFLSAPCAPLMAVMLTILEKISFTATITVFGIILSQMYLAGVLANLILPGPRASLLLEIPPMRIPKPFVILKSAFRKTYFFVREAVPLFVLASALMFVIDRIGGLLVLERVLAPVTNNLLGLPSNSVQVFIKTIIRRESGAAELLNISGGYNHLQLVVCLLVMAFMIPCINATMVLYKERGAMPTVAICSTVILWAIVVGAVINHFCLFMGITF